MRLFKRHMLGVLLLALAAAACDDDVAPTTPTPDPTTVTFSGAVTPNGARTHEFATAAGGTVTATLTRVAGPEGATIGFSLGTWNAGASRCSVVLANDEAAQGAVLSGTMSGIGDLCLRMYDAGSLAAGSAIEYTVEVVHP